MASTGVANGEAFCCGVAVRGLVVSYRFAEGSIVYSVRKAMRGIMERVAIKSVRLVANRRTQGRQIPLYTDTFNSLWNENQLCTEAEARDYAIAYLERRQQDAIEAMERCE
jgi:hypothetical protein